MGSRKPGRSAEGGERGRSDGDGPRDRNLTAIVVPLALALASFSVGVSVIVRNYIGVGFRAIGAVAAAAGSQHEPAFVRSHTGGRDRA